MRLATASALPRHGRLGLGGVDLALQERAPGLRDEAQRFGRGEVAETVVLGGVRRYSKTFVALGRVGAGGGLDLPCPRLASVVAQHAVGSGGEDREVGVGVLGELEVALPRLGGARELLPSRCGEGRRAGVVV